MTKSQELAKIQFSDADLASITDFDSVGALLKSGQIPVESMDNYGTGFRVLDDKSKLVGVPFIILETRESKGDKGAFASLVVVTKVPVLVDGRSVCKLVVNDGSTGIRDQIRNIIEARTRKDIDPQTPLYVEHGLRVSEYEYIDPQSGEVSKAKTYYLSA